MLCSISNDFTQDILEIQSCLVRLVTFSRRVAALKQCLNLSKLPANAHKDFGILSHGARIEEAVEQQDLQGRVRGFPLCAFANPFQRQLPLSYGPCFG